MRRVGVVKELNQSKFMFNWSQKLTVGGKRKEKTNFVQEIDSWEKKKKQFWSGNQIRNSRACLVNNTTKN